MAVLPRFEMAPARDAVNAKTTTAAASVSGNLASFPFWNAATGGSPTVLRFLWSQDDGHLPFATRYSIKLPFDGVVGGKDDPVLVQVTSPVTFGQACPITEGI